jgi:DnaJ family protein A protein 2
MFHSFFQQEDVSRPPPDPMGFYRLLGVEKTADTATIKKAYRTLAMQHHPDKGGDPEKFKELQRANEILSDPDKRTQYDHTGQVGNQEPPHAFHQMFHGMPRGGTSKNNLDMRLKVSLADMYTGTTRSVSLRRRVICTDCKGKGGKNVTTCHRCHGKGIQIITKPIGPGMIQQIQVQCHDCRGTGELCESASRCVTCHGNKVHEVDHLVVVTITKKTQVGDTLLFRNEGHQFPGTATGDVTICIECEEHPVFVRKGPHLFLQKSILLLDALVGFSFVFTHLDGRIFVIKSSPGTIYTDGYYMVIRGEGMSCQRTMGNLYIRFLVKFPTTLTEHARTCLPTLLPGPGTHLATVPDHAVHPVVCNVTAHEIATVLDSVTEQQQQPQCRTQ